MAASRKNVAFETSFRKPIIKNFSEGIVHFLLKAKVFYPKYIWNNKYCRLFQLFSSILPSFKKWLLFQKQLRIATFNSNTELIFNEFLENNLLLLSMLLLLNYCSYFAEGSNFTSKVQLLKDFRTLKKVYLYGLLRRYSRQFSTELFWIHDEYLSRSNEGFLSSGWFLKAIRNLDKAL